MIEIAKNVPDVDVVVGGHTNTFLYNGTQPSNEKIMGNYPTEIKQTSVKTILPGSLALATLNTWIFKVLLSQ